MEEKYVMIIVIVLLTPSVFGQTSGYFTSNVYPDILQIGSPNEPTCGMIQNNTILNEDFEGNLSGWKTTDHTYKQSKWNTVDPQKDISTDGNLSDWETHYSLGTGERNGETSNASYTTDGTKIYFNLENVNLDTSADLFIYLDTNHDTGSNRTQAWNGGNTHTLPFNADYYIGVEGKSYNRLFEWNNSWVDKGVQNVYSGRTGNEITEVALPWSNISHEENRTIRFVMFTQWDTADIMDRAYPAENQLDEPLSSQTPQSLEYYATIGPLCDSFRTPVENTSSLLYGNDYDEKLVLEDVNLTDADTPYFKMTHTLDLSDNNDCASIKVDGNEIWSRSTDTYYWEECLLNLTDYVGDVVDIQFHFFSDGDNSENATGWRIASIWIQELRNDEISDIAIYNMDNTTNWETADLRDKPSLWHMVDTNTSRGYVYWCGDDESGKYTTDMEDALLYNGTVNIPDDGSTTVLEFWHRMETEESSDMGRVQISTDNSSWDNLNTYESDIDNWKTETIDISPYGGSTVYLRFLFESDGDNEHEGWFLDDIKVYNYTTSFQGWNEGFEGGSLPTGWSQVNESGSIDWTFQSGGHSGNPSSAKTGSYNAFFYDNSYGGYTTKLITNVTNISGLSNPVLTFWHAQDDWSGDQDTLEVYYRTSANASWNSLAKYRSSVPDWTLRTLSLPNASSIYYVAFEGVQNYGHGVCIDEVFIGQRDDINHTFFIEDPIEPPNSTDNWTGLNIFNSPGDHWENSAWSNHTRNNSWHINVTSSYDLLLNSLTGPQSHIPKYYQDRKSVV